MSQTKQLVRGLKVSYPTFHEQTYRKQLLRLVSRLKSLTRRYLIDNQGFQSSYNTAIRQDDITDDLESVISLIKAAISLEVTKLATSLSSTYKLVHNFTKRSFDLAFAQIKSKVGYLKASSLKSPNLELIRKLWIKQNIELITSIPNQYLTKIADKVSVAVKNGYSSTSLAKEISSIFRLTDRKAKVIARDQIAKLRSDINRYYELTNGIEIYEWSTSSDDAVRASHKVLSGKLCSWTNSSIYKDSIASKWKQRSSIRATNAHVGQDIMCRCTNIMIGEAVL